jgi:hypothetical protein
MKIGDTVRLINNKDHLYHGKEIITKLTVEHKSSNTMECSDRWYTKISSISEKKENKENT